ncbi:hypothetical protein GQ600_27758 [Phytophthora cactorum]|nr:hypothetical protein GQ600_27758 [Phytophthora cactorum]
MACCRELHNATIKHQSAC